MSFTVGQTVVHPFHGPLRIVEIVERVIQGLPTPCFKMIAPEHALDVTVPVAKVGDVGLREISSPERIAELLGVLAATPASVKTQWSRRMKDYQERMSTGRIDELCVVIREISHSGNKAPASAEGQMLRTARARLSTEIGLSLRITSDEAERVIDVALLGEEAASTGGALVDAATA